MADNDYKVVIDIPPKAGKKPGVVPADVVTESVIWKKIDGHDYKGKHYADAHRNEIAVFKNDQGKTFYQSNMGLTTEEAKKAVDAIRKSTPIKLPGEEADTRYFEFQHAPNTPAENKILNPLEQAKNNHGR